MAITPPGPPPAVVPLLDQTPRVMSIGWVTWIRQLWQTVVDLTKQGGGGSGNGGGLTGGSWEPLANGKIVDSELIFAKGDVIMAFRKRP